LDSDIENVDLPDDEELDLDNEEPDLGVEPGGPSPLGNQPEQ
jgi:hypothetical protein